MLTIGFQDPSSTERIADFGVEHTKSQTRSLSCLAFLLFLKASGVNLREGVPWHNMLQVVQSSLKAGFYTTTADSGMERLVMSGAHPVEHLAKGVLQGSAVHQSSGAAAAWRPKCVPSQRGSNKGCPIQD